MNSPPLYLSVSLNRKLLMTFLLKRLITIDIDSILGKLTTLPSLVETKTMTICKRFNWLYFDQTRFLTFVTQKYYPSKTKILALSIFFKLA